MQTDHSKTIRGLSIATIVVAGLAILACLIGFIFLAVGGSALSAATPEMLDYYYEFDDDYGYSYGYDVDGTEMMALMGLVFGIGGIALFFELICSAVALIAGILGLRFFDKREKMNLLFGWALAGAIVSLLGGNIVVMVLLIIVTVFAYKDKQLGAVAAPVMPAANVVTTAAAPAAAAPVAAAPVQPATAAPVAAPAAHPAAETPSTAVAAEPAAPVAASPALSAQSTTPSEAPEEPKAE